MDLRNVLRDLVHTTSGIDLDCIAISSEDRGQGKRVYMESYTKDRTLIIRAHTKEDVPELTGRFGLGNLGLLQGLLQLKTYNTEGTKISINTKNNAIQSLSITSEEASSVFVVQAEKMIPPQPKFAEREYDVQVTPSAAKVQELKSFSGLYKSFSAVLTPYTEDGSLFFNAGGINKSNHVGSLMFAKTEGTLKQGYGYNIDRVLQAMNRVPNAESATLSISGTGILSVTIDTGIAVYSIFVTGC